MKSNLKGFAENFLFALNVLIVFLLLFESKIVIPHWLIPVGRMHPMILHFPIAILILAMVLEFFRFKGKYQSEAFYQSFTSNLLLIGLLSAAVTVIMGLFLSKEEGYTGNVLQWHKWTGVSIVFFASVIYRLRNYPWYKAPVAKGGALLTILTLLMAGHFGATLTHGESFILGPVWPQETIPKVPLEQAQIYEHLIKPVFKAKCISCHNPDKLKGELLLTDPASIKKGGKSGDFIIPGKPELSLLIKRIHLPVDEKKHMPPTGKPQLTDEEALLLELWIKNGADFKKKVVDLPANDSLRTLAAAFLKPTNSQVMYTFAPADEETINKLNSTYRTVAPLAKESPALSASIYNSANYTPKMLEDLLEVKKQIISLDLYMMPVADAELKTIAQFENLATLNLNFTNVTGEGLGQLANLKYLKSISLSGSKITYNNLQVIKNFKALEMVTVWNTAITDDQIAQLRKANKKIEVVAGYKDDGKPIKLNLPQLKNSKQVFKNNTDITIKHPIRGVELRYTLDGTDPDSLHSAIYKGNLKISNHTTLRTKAFKKGWISSDVAEFRFYKGSYSPDSIILNSKPIEKYLANGPRTLVDNELADLVNLTNRWIGFNKPGLDAVMIFDKPVTLSSVLIQNVTLPLFLVLPPSDIEIWGGPDKDHLKLLSKTQPGIPQVNKAVSVFTDNYCNFAPQKVSYLHIKAQTNTQVLIDEIFLN